MENKTCTKCKIEFPATIEYFTPSKRYKYGITSSCKICRKEYAKVYRKKNPEKVRECQYKWIEANRDRFDEVKREWSKLNRTKTNSYTQKWHKKNPEKKSVYNKKYIDLLKDCYIAKIIGKPKSEITQEIIDTTRLIIQLKRELGFGVGIKKKTKV